MSEGGVEVKCHLLNEEELDSDTLGLDRFESVVDSSHFAVDLCRCHDCGQVYVEVFWEIVDWNAGNDDMWQFYVPLSEDELSRFRQAIHDDEQSARAQHPEIPAQGKVVVTSAAVKLVESRRHIVRDPHNRVFWRDGPEIAFAILA